MPVYEYRCPEGHRFDRFLPLARYKEPQICQCGKLGTRIISIPMLNVDMQPWERYISPVSGKLITSHKERRADMAAHGCVDYEPSLKRENVRRAEAADAALEKKVEDTVEREIAGMSSQKRERLSNEMDAGLDCVYERSTT